MTEPSNAEPPLPEPLMPEPPPLPLRLSPATLLAIFVGGALGTVSRFLLDTAHPTPSGQFPLTTLLINLTGSLAIGLLMPPLQRVAPRFPLLRPFLVVGILGGWTTYSTLAVDTDLLFKGAHAGLALGYMAVTIVGGLALVLIGEAVSRKAAPST
ncbi:MAG TPA: CrcB family protein [Acidimicrobiales bacterium]